MNRNFKNRIYVGIFLLALFTLGYNSSTHLHIHRDSLGRILVHSHPIDTFPTKTDPSHQHNHSNLGLFIYFTLSLVKLLLVTFFFGLKFSKLYVGNMVPFVGHLTSTFFRRPASIRAPPLLFTNPF